MRIGARRRPGVQRKVARFSRQRAHDLERAAQVARSCVRRLGQRGLRGGVDAPFDPRGGATDDEGEQAGRTAQLAAVEDELRRRVRSVAQREHRLGQPRAGAARRTR